MNSTESFEGSSFISERIENDISIEQIPLKRNSKSPTRQRPGPYIKANNLSLYFYGPYLQPQSYIFANPKTPKEGTKKMKIAKIHKTMKRSASKQLKTTKPKKKKLHSSQGNSSVFKRDKCREKDYARINSSQCFGRSGRVTRSKAQVKSKPPISNAGSSLRRINSNSVAAKISTKPFLMEKLKSKKKPEVKPYRLIAALKNGLINRKLLQKKMQNEILRKLVK